MRILQVMAGGKHGGAETAFVDKCIAMHEAGETIEVATRANDIRVPRLEAAGITVHTLPFGGKADVFTRWKMRKIIKAFRPDIVQCWMSRAPWKVPAWDEKMGIPRYYVFARLGNHYKLKYFQSVDRFITITPDIKTYLVENGVPDEHVRHINNFADVEKAEQPITRGQYGVPEDAPLLLGLGRLHTAKAFDTLIEVVAKMPDVYLWIAGEGPERMALEALIERLRCGDRVTLLGWQTDRAALFDAVDICVFSSRYEPFGTVFVQSWAQRVPVVTTTADGPRQFVRDGEDGFVVEIDDQDAMQKAIQDLIDDPALVERFVEAGYKRYENEFTKDVAVKNYLQFYHDVLSERE